MKKRYLNFVIRVKAPAAFDEASIAQVIGKILEIGQADATDTIEADESNVGVDVLLAAELEFGPLRLVTVAGE